MRHNGSSVTLADVARSAGVSLATASRAINGSARQVRPDLRDKVLAAARALNYVADAQAQAMARGRTNVVGLLVHDIADPYFSTIAAGVLRAAEEHGLLVTLCITSRRTDREAEYVAVLRGQRAHAVILTGSREDDPAAQEGLVREVRSFHEAGGRVVAISQPVLAVDTVVAENREGARALARELVGLGYRRFGVLAGPERLLTARDRLTGFREGLQGAGAADPVVVHGRFTRDGGYDQLGELLDRGTPVDCVFAVNDVMEVGAMAACRDRGLTLPGELGLAGFDDISTLRDITPGLTTVRLPLEELGTAAIELLRSEAAQPRVRRAAGEVVVRQSTPRR